MRKAASLALAVVALVAGTACRVSDLSFREDDRVDIVTPENNDTVSLPLVVDWTAEKGLLQPDGSPDAPRRFAVFLDRSPIAPGRDIFTIGRDDANCKARPGCPDEAYLEEQGVFLTTETSLTIPQVRDRRSGESGKDTHEVVVVLLDAKDERIGESAFRVEFFVDRSKDGNDG